MTKSQLENKMNELLQDMYDIGFKAGKAFQNNDLSKANQVEQMYQAIVKKNQDAELCVCHVKNSVYAQTTSDVLTAGPFSINEIEAAAYYDKLSKEKQQAVQEVIKQR